MSEREKLVVDASVAIKWYVPESGSDRATRVLESDHELLAPDLLLVEFGNILWKKTVRGELSAPDSSEILSRRLASRRITYISIPPLIQSALEIAVRYKHPIYDALYLAVAVAHDGRLVTADSRLVQAFQGTDLGPFVLSLAAF